MSGRSRPRPILYVHHRPELGGAPTSLSYLLRALDRDRFEPHVYCPPGPVTALFRESGAIVHEGPVAAFTHIWASTYSGRRWILLGRELAQLPAHAAQLIRTLRSRDFSLVHLNDSPLLPAAATVRARGVPVIWHLRSSLPHDGTDLRSKLMQTAVGSLGSTSIAISRDVARTFGVDAHIVPNSVDLERFRPGDGAAAKIALGIAPEKRVVAYFGFIYPSKGLEDFIHAAALLRRRGHDALYLIVGGPVRGSEFFETLLGRTLERMEIARNHAAVAQDLVNRLQLTDMVRFLPFTADTTSLYLASDVVAAPSRGPELGRPVLEAAACGRAVVASGSTSGAGILLPDETGYLVPRRSPEVMAAALERLLVDQSLRQRVGANARRHAEQHFDPTTNARRVMDIYEAVMA